jgi:extracellular elastinolytic metalloproteinase
VRADGYGHARLHAELTGSGPQTLRVRLAPNHAAASAGAVASGSGERMDKLIDETEATNWQSIGNQPTVDVAQPSVTVALAGGSQDITRVQVSGVLQVVVGEKGQNRYSSIHQFALATCDAATADCTQAANFTQVYVSPSGGFPSASFRPIVSDMTIREFRLPQPVRASHVRFVALHNKCTGTAAYQGYLGVPGQEDADPTNVTDCRVANGPDFPARTTDVRAAELQVFGADAQLLLGDGIFSDGYESADPMLR